MTRATRFDLASLTKPLATTTAVMLLLDEGSLGLQDPVSRFLPGFESGEKSRVRIFHLLNHSSGLRAWRPYYRELGDGRRIAGSPAGKKAIYEKVHAEKLNYTPGTQSLYSDLGFILLGEIVERAGGLPLDRFCRDRIFRPLSLRGLGYRKASPAGAGRFAATERCPWRGRVLHGEVQDENAWAMGGTAGHAGLFGTAMEVFYLTQRILLAADGKERGFVAPKTAEAFVSRAGTPHSSFALGWDTPSAPSSSGRFFSPRSFGHLGFTGVSVWADRDRGLVAVLLTNRVHPTRRNIKIRAFRPAIHDLIVKEFAK
jgi:CubicO group peptidase (beta-lactamase class C family)